MKNQNQIIGGVSGIIEGCLYIFGFILLLFFFQPIIDQATTELNKLTFIIENKSIYQVWMIFIYVVFGIVLIPLTIAISENFENQTALLIKSTSIFGFIWSGFVIASGMIAVVGIESVATIYNTDSNLALSTWKTIETIQSGLGGGVEIIGGIWVFLISFAGIKHSKFNKYINYFGFIVGGAGILTIFPGLKDLGAVFGLTQIIWFFWLGISMIKNGQ